MSKNRNIILLIAGFLLILIVMLLTTEFREVSDHKWNESFDFEDEEPQGLYIFKELAERYFDTIPLTLNDFAPDSLGENGLYIQFVPNFMSDEVFFSLFDLVHEGHDVLIISDNFNINLADTLSYSFDNVFQIGNQLEFNFLDPEIARDYDYRYTFLNEEFNDTLTNSFNLIEGTYWDTDKTFVKVATPDSLALMVAFPFGEGRLFYHAKKDLFYNHSFRQDGMFDYTERIFAHFAPDHISLLDPRTASEFGSNDDKNPLQFIMSNPPLKAAYYLLILGALLYVIFRGKRKQRVIPVLKKKQNTSLQYVDTVSQLFYQQGQHEKLVSHMRNIFYHKMQKKFFIPPDHKDYVQVLSKKSRISATELQYVIDRFNSLDDYFTFNENELISLNRRLENIYSKIEKR